MHAHRQPTRSTHTPVLPSPLANCIMLNSFATSHVTACVIEQTGPTKPGKRVNTQSRPNTRGALATRQTGSKRDPSSIHNVIEKQSHQVF